MRAIGVDIGTTTISFIVVDMNSGDVLDCINTSNQAAYPGAYAYEQLQDPEVIFSLINTQLELLKKLYTHISVIGFTGQMHGMLYVDAQGQAVSPLYTWQDGHGNIEANGETMAQILSALTNRNMATGYGLTTHFALTRMGKVPTQAEKLCTIADYVAMRLLGQTRPICHASNAASMGLFDIVRGEWDWTAVIRAGLSIDILPKTTTSCVIIGEDQDGIPVACAIGDGQASFNGSVSEPEHSVLVNVGTGAQVSMASRTERQLVLCEQRPLEGRSTLLVGSSLCGGRAYALLHHFLLDCAKLMNGKTDSLYARMNKAALSVIEDSSLNVNTRFCGSRSNPLERGSISNIGMENFSVAHLSAGVLWGMADELWSFYNDMTTAGAKSACMMIGSGNGVRQNPALRYILSQRFGIEIKVPVFHEEAAYGAVLFACGALYGEQLAKRMRHLIRYQCEE